MSPEVEDEVVENVKEAKRPRKLSKSIDLNGKSVEIEVLGSEEGVLVYELSELSDEIVTQLTLHGLSQKLGDGAAGKTSAEASADIAEIWEALKNDSFATPRASGAARTSKKAILEKMSLMGEEERAATQAVLEKLDFKF